MTTKQLLGAIVAVVIVGGIAFIALNSGYEFPQFKSTSKTNTGATPSATLLPDDFQVYGRNFNVGTQTTDKLDVTIPYGDDTELDTICWDAQGSDDTSKWTKLASFSEAELGDANIDIDEGILDAEGNIISHGTTEMWCEFNLESSQDFFVDQAEILRANDRMDSCIWVDANDDNDGTWACRYNLVGITGGIADPNNEPSDTLQLYLFDEETDSGAQTIMDTEVASVGSVAQSTQTTELLTHLDFTGAGDVVVISDIRARNNLTSSTSDIFSEDTEICFEDSTAEMVWFDTREKVGCLKLSDRTYFDKDQQSSTTEWYWTGGSDYKDGILVMVPKNANTQVDIPTNIKTKFTSATQAVCFELAFKYVDAFANKSSFDAVDVEITSDSVGDECAIS